MTSKKDTPPDRVVLGSGHPRWLPIADLHVSERAQRDHRPEKSEAIAAAFDPDMFGVINVSERDGKFWIVDGQHRIAALRLMGWHDQQVQCWVTIGTSEQRDAKVFLGLNDTRNVSAYDKFRIGITAGLHDECDIERIVLANGAVISSNHYQDNSTKAVSALRDVYRRGPEVLGRTIRIILGAYGGRALQSNIIKGVGMFCARYGDQVDEALVIDRLNATRGGVSALEQQGNVFKQQTGKSKPYCIAGAVVQIVNSGRKGKKLANWWTVDS